jgi:hypothetical protein
MCNKNNDDNKNGEFVDGILVFFKIKMVYKFISNFKHFFKSENYNDFEKV